MSVNEKNGLAKCIKLYLGGFAEHMYSQFQKSQYFALTIGVLFDILSNNNEEC